MRFIEFDTFTIIELEKMGENILRGKRILFLKVQYIWKLT